MFSGDDGWRFAHCARDTDRKQGCKLDWIEEALIPRHEPTSPRNVTARYSVSFRRDKLHLPYRKRFVDQLRGSGHRFRSTDGLTRFGNVIAQRHGPTPCAALDALNNGIFNTSMFHAR